MDDFQRRRTDGALQEDGGGLKTDEVGMGDGLRCCAVKCCSCSVEHALKIDMLSSVYLCGQNDAITGQDTAAWFPTQCLHLQTPQWFWGPLCPGSSAEEHSALSAGLLGLWPRSENTKGETLEKQIHSKYCTLSKWSSNYIQFGQSSTVALTHHLMLLAFVDD